MLKWVINIYDPKGKDAKYNLVVEYGKTRKQTWENLMQYLSDKHIGEPKPTNAYSVKELKKMNMVGVYIEE